MKHRRTMTVSLCLNLALTGATVYSLTNPVSIKPIKHLSETPASTVSTEEAFRSRVEAPRPAPIVCVTNRFVWSQVEAADSEQLAMNLRAIGCPEKTVRDVIVCRVRRGLDRISRGAESKRKVRPDGAPRTLNPEEEAAAAARAKLLASVEQALGRGVFTEDCHLMENFVDQALVRFLSGPMPEETFLRFAALIARHEERRDEIRARKQEASENEDALKNLGRQFRFDLASVLSPAELEEFNARSAMSKFADDVRFDMTDLSSAEIRQIALIRARFQDPDMGEWFHDASLSKEQEDQVGKAIRTFLGEPRYAQLERARNDDFKPLFEVGRDHNLPSGAAVTAFELRQLAAREAADLREDPTLSETERGERLAQLQVQAQEGVLKVLGAKACAQYLNQGGSWLTNMNGL